MIETNERFNDREILVNLFLRRREREGERDRKENVKFDKTN